jgi:hypothetical protein
MTRRVTDHSVQFSGLEPTEVVKRDGIWVPIGGRPLLWNWRPAHPPLMHVSRFASSETWRNWRRMPRWLFFSGRTPWKEVASQPYHARPSKCPSRQPRASSHKSGSFSERQPTLPSSPPALAVPISATSRAERAGTSTRGFGGAPLRADPAPRCLLVRHICGRTRRCCAS